MPRRFSSSCPPPASIGVMWSTCVDAALLQTVHTGCSLSTSPLFFRYLGSLCCLLIGLAPSQAQLLSFVVGDVSCPSRSVVCVLFSMLLVCRLDLVR